MKSKNILKFTGMLVLLILTVSFIQPVKADANLVAPAAGLSIPDFRYPVVGIGEGVSYEIGSLAHTGPDTYAVDFVYPTEGIDIYPTLGGRVVYVGYLPGTPEQPDYGWVVVIRHWDDTKWDQKYYSIYAHLKPGSITVNLWDVVDGSRPIGQMGKSGYGANGVVHLHFAVRSSSNVYDGLVALYGKQNGMIVTPAFNVRPYLH